MTDETITLDKNTTRDEWLGYLQRLLDMAIKEGYITQDKVDKGMELLRGLLNPERD